MRRKCRRMMAFTSDRLYIVRVDDGKAKASYPLKSVQLAPSDKVNQASARRSTDHRVSVFSCVAEGVFFSSPRAIGVVTFGVSRARVWGVLMVILITLFSLSDRTLRLAATGLVASNLRASLRSLVLYCTGEGHHLD